MFWIYISSNTPQYANPSPSYFSFSYFEFNRSEFSILKNDDYNEKEYLENDDIFVSERETTPHCLAIGIKNQLPFLTFNDFHDFIFSNFSQGLLQAENEAKNEQVYEQQIPDLGPRELKENI